jgi:beta-mannanase
VRAPGSTRRLSPRVLVALLVIALFGALTISARAFPPGVDRGRPELEPRAAWLGAWVKPADSFSKAASQKAVLQLESKINRRLAIDHTYVPWGRQLGWRPAWDISMGRIPLITIGAEGDTDEVATGRHDVYLRTLSEAVRKLGRPVFMRYGHRMDASDNREWVHSPSSFIAAWRHVHDVFADLPVSWAWTPTADAFGGGQADQWYPGDQYVDWIGADGFNGYGCGVTTAWRELADIFGDFYAWGKGRDKPLMIAETGSTEDPADPGRKGRWFDNATRTLATRMPNVEAVVYFHAAKRCEWRADSSPESLAGFRRMANDPHFQTMPVPPTPTPPTSTTRPTPTSTTVPPTPTTTPPPQPGPPGLSPLLVPSQGALWGTSKFTEDWERQMGRRFDIVHTYHRWDENFPTADERAWANDGRFLLMNWKPSRGGAVVRWAAIAGGSEDAQIVTTATRLKSLGQKMFLVFHHEPEDDVGAWGSANDFARAFAHVHDVFRRVGADNVLFAWTMMGYTAGYGSMYDDLYPGDQYVDWIAWDPYNWWDCHANGKWRSFVEISGPFYEWATTNQPDKPLMLAEFGTREKEPGAKAAWFRDALRSLKAERSRLKAVVYFNNLHTCDWRITSSSDSVAAYRGVGLDPYLNRVR